MAMTSVNGRWTGPAGVFPCVRAGLVLVVTLELVAPALANAQVRVGTPDELPGILGPGDLISVVHTGGVSVRGRVLRLGDTDLDIRTDTREPSGQQRHLDVKIPLAAIQSLERPRDPLRNGVLIGAAVGAGCVGAMFGYAVGGRPQRDRRMGADLSGIRGAVHGDWRTGGLGGRFGQLETARQIRQALHGDDHGESDASAVAETGPGCGGRVLRTRGTRAQMDGADTSG
jgi:hypothetical protein